jgi:DNA-binding response OmpR family regulator
MSGKELADRLALEQPGVKVLFVTGFPGDPRAIEAVEAKGEVLEKPFHGLALVARVERLLERRTP